MIKKSDLEIRKSDLASLFELASGELIEDYLNDRASRRWTWVRISEDMNSQIRRLLTRKVFNAGLFKINTSNLNRWYTRFGIKSKLKSGGANVKKRRVRGI